MPETASRDLFLGDAAGMDFGNDAANEFGYVLTRMSFPAVWLETLRCLGKDGHLDSTKIPDAQLQQ
jgi:hypothetical protein